MILSVNIVYVQPVQIPLDRQEQEVQPIFVVNIDLRIKRYPLRHFFGIINITIQRPFTKTSISPNLS